MTLLVVAAIFTITAALNKTYHILWFFAGVSWWAVGVWWIYYPLGDTGSPINNILVVLAFLGGAGLMLVMGWRTRTENGKEVGGHYIRMPGFLSEQSDEEEEMRRNITNSQARRAAYRERVNGAVRGRRTRR